MSTPRIVYLWQNNLVFTIDSDGQQMPKLQGKVYDPKAGTGDILDRLIQQCDDHTLWKIGNWDTGEINSCTKTTWLVTANKRRKVAEKANRALLNSKKG